MSTQEVRQISTTELPTWLREYQEDILARAQGLARDPLARPAYQIADLTPQQLQASQLAIGGVGSYFPMLQAGVETTGLGVGSLAEGYNQQLNAAPWLQQAGSAVNDAIGGNLGYRNEAADMFRNALPQITDSTQDALRRLRGTGARFNPEDITPFMNHYEDAAVQQALKDIDRSGQIAQRGLRQRATGMGAFGGSRAQIAESELSRNTLLQQGRTAAQMRNTGYMDAARRSQQAFEDAMRRRMSGSQIAAGLGTDAAMNTARLAQGLGALGTSYGQLGLSGAGQLAGIATGYGNMSRGLGALGQGLTSAGLRQAQLGEAYQGLNLNDINTLMQTGAMEQQQQQSIYDANRQTQIERMMQPYQQLGFYSDVYQGMPSMQTSLFQTQQPSPSRLSQLGGLGMGLYSLSQYNQQ